MIKEVNVNEWKKGWFEEMAEVIDLERTVQVYRNLHKKCWSIRQDGKVLVHAGYVILRNVEFKVQPAGRQKVLDEQKKNVHAYVKGYLISARESNRITEDIEWTCDVVSYNPYKHPYFTCGEFEVVRAEVVDMDIDAEDKLLAYGMTIKAKELV